MRSSLHSRAARPGRPASARGGQPAHAVLALQRMAGNRATAALLRQGRTTGEFAYAREKEGGARKGGWYRKTVRADEAHKNKPADRAKYKTDWLIKGGVGYSEAEPDEAEVTELKSLDAVKEVFASTLFAALAGARFTGKTRLVKGPDQPAGLADVVGPQQFWSASKQVPGFKSHEQLMGAVADPGSPYAPGLGRILFFGLFLGESDWNTGNYGLAPHGAVLEARRIDIASLSLHWAKVETLLTPEGLIGRANGIAYRPDQVDPREIQDAVRDLLATGEQTIQRVADEFRDAFAEIKGAGVLERLRTGLLERVRGLRALV